jgi:large subunit ribosomal protein L23
MSSDLRRVIKSHLVTERSTSLKEANNEYVFEVDKKASKFVIKQAIEQVFKVKVASVHTMIVPGKLKRMGRNQGKTPTWKKAVVRLQKDQRIALFENM